MPSVREMRGQLYTALVSGATGILYFAMDQYVTRAGGVVGIAPRECSNETYFDSSTSDHQHTASPSLLQLSNELWDGVARLNTELLSITPVIFAPTSRKSEFLQVSFSGNNCTATPVRVMWKQLADGTEYLIATNVDKGSVTARFDFAGVAGPRLMSAQLLFEAHRSVSVNNSAFVDFFEEMDVHVYRLIYAGSVPR